MYNQKPLLGTLPNYAHPLTPTAAWIMNEGSGNKIYDIINSNHGTFGAGAAAPTWVPEGLNFGGGGYVDCGDFDIDGNGTITAWIYPISVTGNNAIIMKCNDIGDSSLTDLSLYVDDGYLKVQIGTGTNYQIQASTLAVVTNIWQFVAVSVDGTNIKFYVDDNSQISSQTVIPAGNAYKYSIGRLGEYDGFYFNGIIDEGGIYSWALTASEIWQLYVDPYCWLAEPYQAELMRAAPPVGLSIPVAYHHYEALRVC